MRTWRAALGFALVLPAASCASAPAAPAVPVAHVAAHGISAVLRRSERGHGNAQYFLTVRHEDRIVFRSPGDPGRLIPRLTRPEGAPYWFPLQTVHLAGIATMGGTPFVVIAEHNIGADCGSGRVGLIGPKGRVIVVENACALGVRIEQGNLVLSGPFYGPDAPLVNPTIPHATSRLTIAHGRIVQTPSYFKVTSTTR